MKIPILAVLLGVVGAAGVPLLVHEFEKAAESAHRVQCANNMLQIGFALNHYQDDNHGTYPPDLGTLVKTTDITTTAFACPSTATNAQNDLVGDRAVDWVNRNTDYIYNGAGLVGLVNSSYIMLFDKDSNHDRVMNVVYADGHCEMLSAKDAHGAIDRGLKRRQQRDRSPIYQASQLGADYAANEVAADENYKGKAIRIDGSVSNVVGFSGHSIDVDSAHIVLKGSGRDIHCWFTGGEFYVMDSLRPNDSIVIFGTCEGLKSGTLTMSECELVGSLTRR